MSYRAITSSQNARYKQALKLRQRRGRDRADRILVDGARELSAAVAGGVQIETVLVPDSYDRTWHAMLDAISREGGEILLVPPALMERIGYSGRADQPVALALPPVLKLRDMRLPAVPLVAVLEGVEKPGNLGAIVRSADAAGVDAVIVADPGTDLYNPNAIRASLGTIFTKPICAASTTEVVSWLQEHSIVPCVTRVDASSLYDAFDFRQPTAIVLGSEAWGVSAAWKSLPQQSVRLPMHGHADSLNVSATAAILFYEADRQRR